MTSDLISKNRKVAEFLKWDKCIYQERITNPKHPQYKIPQPKIEAFCLPESHPIVENIYTDTPYWKWNHDEDYDGYEEGDRRLILFDRDLRFHSDWNWLILAIDKIEKRIVDKNGFSGMFSLKIEENQCEIIFNSQYFYSVETPEIYSRFNNKIESTFDCVIQFVEWYNNNSNLIYNGE